MRGKVSARAAVTTTTRITPARAGKRGAGYDLRAGPQDHPRACGEKIIGTYYNYDVTGSPPRVRGKAGGESAKLNFTGITPARAGKRSSVQCAERSARDHPRACGEKYLSDLLEIAEQGSPPRVRGKALSFGVICYRPGITPARAGKSYEEALLEMSDRDHPRACGEKAGSMHTFWLRAGSPPRVRGKD